MPRPRVGLAVREENRHLIDGGAVSAAEITLERAENPLRLSPYVRPDDLEYLSLHCLKLSVASPDPPPERYLLAVEAAAREFGVDAISDHLGFTRGPQGIELGHFAPPPMTRAALEATCRNLRLLQERFAPRPFFLENITYQFQFEGTMEETEFLSEILSATGCGWLLDVTNVYANAVNFQYDPYEFIASVIPAATSLQIHLSGGYRHPRTGRYVDSHSRPIPEPVWNLYAFAAELAGDRLQAVFIERDEAYPDDGEWRSELRRAEAIGRPAGAAS